MRVLALFSLAALISLCGCDFKMAVDSKASGLASNTGGHASAVFTDENFQEKVLNSSQIVLVDAWAPW